MRPVARRTIYRRRARADVDAPASFDAPASLSPAPPDGIMPLHSIGGGMTQRVGGRSNLQGGVKIGVVMGSDSDWDVMRHTARVLDEYGIAHETKVVSAHRTPDLLVEYAKSAQARGVAAIVAGAGGAAHLPGMLAANTIVPVLGVPVPSRHLQGLDSLLSIVQMPRGVPVATFAIGEAGAVNAGLFAVALLAREDGELAQRLADYRAREEARVRELKLPSP